MFCRSQKRGEKRCYNVSVEPSMPIPGRMVALHDILPAHPRLSFQEYVDLRKLFGIVYTHMQSLLYY